MLELNDVTDSVALEEAGREVDILGIDGTPMLKADGAAAKMRIRGTYSQAFTKTQNKIAERNRRRPKAATEEQNDADNYETWGACVASWDLLIGGQPAKPADVFKRFPNIYNQVISEARDHVSFSAAVSSNS